MKPYKPADGTAGGWFLAAWCVRCDRCDYGPVYNPDGDKGECRGAWDPDEPCRNAEPHEYEEDEE